MTQIAHAALAHDALLPRSPGGQGPGAALSMVVHAGLIAALATSVDWRAQAPEVFSAEIWASLPQAAAPAPMEAPPPAPPAPPPAPEPAPLQRTAPPPPTPDADIAIERDRKRKAEVAQRELDERKKVEAERKKADTERKQAEAERKQAEADRKRAAAEKKQAEQQERDAKADDERLARQREENLKRMMGQAGGTGTATAGTGTGTAAQSAGPSATYAGKVIAAVRPNIKFPGDVPGNATAEVEVRAAAGGSIISSRIVKKSGHDDWDAAVLRAIDRTGALPRDSDGRVPTTIVIVFRRE